MKYTMNSKRNREIASQFAKDHGIMATYCEQCENWYVHCRHCDTQICCYSKACCIAAFDTWQPKLRELLQS